MSLTPERISIEGVLFLIDSVYATIFLSLNAPVAQLVEQHIRNVHVAGSTPVGGSIRSKMHNWIF